jgi:hydroxymethylpyrimidine/phosphomethylpyrimidine kinase
VLDPVMVATSGDPLFEAGTVSAIVRDLFPLAALVTPNLDEAELLLNRPVRAESEMIDAARACVDGLGARGALIKGGHGTGAVLVDVLFDGREVHRFRHPRIATTSTHGTGCTLSASIAAHLALGHELVDAVSISLDYVHRAMASAPGLGAGHGPLDHSA